LKAWINGRRQSALDPRDRGLQYGDGLFETMRVQKRGIRLLDYHLERLAAGCGLLRIRLPKQAALRRELQRIAALRQKGVLKLIVTRGAGPRGYRPRPNARATRIVTLHALPRHVFADAEKAVRLRICTTPLSTNPRLAGIKSLNRLDSVLARGEWTDARIWEGLMRDVDGNWVCGTMSNLFLRRGSVLTTPLLDRCGVAGVMRRWILENAAAVQLRIVERRVQWRDFQSAEEIFMSNAVAGICSVRTIDRPGATALRIDCMDAARALRSRLAGR
jgi:4-amino-4-deoxychorismate lyase